MQFPLKKKKVAHQSFLPRTTLRALRPSREGVTAHISTEVAFKPIESSLQRGAKRLFPNMEKLPTVSVQKCISTAFWGKYQREKAEAVHQNVVKGKGKNFPSY